MASEITCLNCGHPSHAGTCPVVVQINPGARSWIQRRKCGCAVSIGRPRPRDEKPDEADTDIQKATVQKITDHPDIDQSDDDGGNGAA